MVESPKTIAAIIITTVVLWGIFYSVYTVTRNQDQNDDSVDLVTLQKGKMVSVDIRTSEEIVFNGVNGETYVITFINRYPNRAFTFEIYFTQEDQFIWIGNDYYQIMSITPDKIELNRLN